MNVRFHKAAQLFCWIMLGILPGLVQAQNPALAPSNKPGTGPRPTPGVTQPKYTEEQVQEIVAKLQDRIKIATDLVFGRIQKAESDIRLRFSYLRKPERLDPNAYGSKEDVAAWQNSVQQLRDAENTLDKLYANADLDLGNALTQQRINPSIADQLKNQLMTTIPSATIKKKSELMHQYIEDHQELLNFYDKNWGSWKPGTGPGSATFSDPSLATAFQSLKEKINATGEQIDEQYRAMQP
jgi:hypothetical protein